MWMSSKFECNNLWNNIGYDLLNVEIHTADVIAGGDLRLSAVVLQIEIIITNNCIFYTSTHLGAIKI